MAETSKIDRIVDILRKCEQPQAIKHLPTAKWAQKIIIYTNQGKFSKALKEIENSKSIYLTIENEMNAEDKEWYADILKRMLDSVLSAKNSTE